MDYRPRNRFADNPTTVNNSDGPNGNQQQYSERVLLAQRTNHQKINKRTCPDFTRQDWRQIHRERCRHLWNEIPAEYLNRNLSLNRDHLILMKATLEWINDTRLLLNIEIPPAAPECDLGMLSGKPSASGDNGTRQERILFWEILNTLPPAYGKDLLHEIGGDPQQRIIYLAHRYVRFILNDPL